MWSLAREISLVADIVYRRDSGVSAGKAMSDAGVWRSRQNLTAPLHDAEIDKVRNAPLSG